MTRNRICIYAKDISLITGRGQKYAQKLLRDIRFVHQKEAHQFVTVKEFSDYTGISLELISEVVK